MRSGDKAGPVPGIVEVGACHGRINQFVGPCTTNHADTNALPGRAGDDCPIATPVEIQADFFRVLRVERVAKIRGALHGSGRRIPHVQPHLNPVIDGANHLGEFRLVGRVDLGFADDDRVEFVSSLREIVAAFDERPGQLLASSLIDFWRQIPHRPVDDLVRELALQRRHSGVPNGFVETHQKAAVEIPTVSGKARDIGIILPECNDSGLVEVEQPQGEPVHADERLVAVSRNGFPQRLVSGLERRPTPVVRPTVAVAKEDVDEARFQERTRVDAMAGILVEVSEQPVGTHNIDRAGETGGVCIALVRSLFENSQQAPELCAELAEAWIVRRHSQHRRCMQHPRGLEQRRYHERGVGMIRADLIPNDRKHERLAEFLGKSLREGRILIDRPEHVPFAVGPLQVQGSGGCAATPPDRRESPGVRRHVQQLGADGSGPQIAVRPAKKESVEPARPIVAPSDDGNGITGPRVGHSFEACLPDSGLGCNSGPERGGETTSQEQSDPARRRIWSGGVSFSVHSALHLSVGST